MIPTRRPLGGGDGGTLTRGRLEAAALTTAAAAQIAATATAAGTAPRVAIVPGWIADVPCGEVQRGIVGRYVRERERERAGGFRAGGGACCKVQVNKW
jgi:hypothetical protein